MSLKKTIIYVGGFELPDKNGAAQRVIANGKIFRSLGYDVVFCGVAKGIDSNSNILETKTNHFGFTCFSTVYPVSKKMWLETISSSESIEYLVQQCYQGQVAAVICYNHPALAQWRIRRLCRKYNIKYLADVTEWYESSGGGVIFGFIKWLDTSLRMRVMHRIVDALITTSSIITEFYARTKKFPIVELPTLYDNESISLNRSEERLDSNISRWIYAGSPFNAARLDRKRENIKDRLDAVVILAARLNSEAMPVELRIYGVTKDDYLKAFPEHLSILTQNIDQILFFGNRPHKEILQQLQQSDFSIFFRKKSRLTEAGFPSKLAESISCGTPVITNYLGNLESYKSKVSGLFLVDFSNMDDCVKETKQILQMSALELKAVKAACLEEQAFDYRTFIPKVQKFMHDANL